MEKQLFVYNSERDSLKIYLFQEIISLGIGVTMVHLQNGDSVVLKQKKSYTSDGTWGDAKNVVISLIGKCSVYLEQDLQLYLMKKEPNHIAQLAFPSSYAYFMQGKRVVPVKITQYYECERTRDRNAMKKIESQRLEIEQRIEDAIKEYYLKKGPKVVMDQDWKNKRNRLYTRENILYHDFDHSI